MRGDGLRLLLLFLLVSVVVGPMLLGGSIAGALISRPALFIGALAGALAGIAVSVHAAARLRLIPVHARFRTALGAAIGLAMAAILATQPDWQSPVGPFLSGGLVPLVAVLASRGRPRGRLPQPR